MILAAGRGERMRPLTDTCPKPLIKVGGLPLIEHHIRKLAQVGITEIVINLAWLGEQIKAYLGNGDKWRVKIKYSDEADEALETAGGIINALPLLGEQPFLVINGDVYCDYNFKNMPTLSPDIDAHLWLVDNPDHNPDGDFTICQNLLSNKLEAETCYTFSGIAIYRPTFFSEHTAVKHKLPLAPMLRQGADNKKISASKISSDWVDVGTIERLTKLNQTLAQRIQN